MAGISTSHTQSPHSTSPALFLYLSPLPLPSLTLRSPSHDHIPCITGRSSRSIASKKTPDVIGDTGEHTRSGRGSGGGGGGGGGEGGRGGGGRGDRRFWSGLWVWKWLGIWIRRLPTQISSTSEKHKRSNGLVRREEKEMKRKEQGGRERMRSNVPLTREY